MPCREPRFVNGRTEGPVTSRAASRSARCKGDSNGRSVIPASRRNFWAAGKMMDVRSVAARLSLVRRRPASTGSPCSPRRLTPWSTFGSLGTYCGVRCPDRPPGREHRFGHEKGEAVAEVGPASVLEIVEGGDEAVERTKRAIKRAPWKPRRRRTRRRSRSRSIQPPPQNARLSVLRAVPETGLRLRSRNLAATQGLDPGKAIPGPPNASLCSRHQARGSTRTTPPRPCAS